MLNKGLEYVLRLNDQISAPIKNIKAEVDGFAVGIKAIAGVSAAFATATAAVTAFVDANVTALDEIHQLSNVTGASANAIFTLGQMAEVNGSSVQAAQASISGLSKVIGEAAKGVGKGANAFKAFGLSATDSNGKIKGTFQVLDEIRGKMQGLSEQEQIAMLSKLGIDGSLIQTLRLSGDELTALHERTEAFSLGAATNENARSAAEFKDAMTELFMVFKGATQFLAVSLAPTLTNIITKFNDWYVANNQLIKNGLNRLIKGIEDFFNKAFSAIQKIDDFISSTIGWENAMYALIGVFLAAKRSPIFSLWDTLSSVIKSFSLVFTGPIALMTKAIPLFKGVGEAGENGAKGITVMQRILGGIPKAFTAIKTAITGAFLPFSAGLLAITAISVAVYALREEIGAFLSGVLSGFRDWGLSFEPIKNAFGRVVELFNQIFGLSQQNAQSIASFASAGQLVGQIFGASFDIIINAITFSINAFSTLLETVIGVVSGIMNGWTEFTGLLSSGEWVGAFSMLWQGIANIGTQAWESLKISAIEAINGIINIINKFGANIEPLEIPVKTQMPATLPQEQATTPQAVAGASTYQPPINSEGKTFQIASAKPRTEELNNYKSSGKAPMTQTNNNQKTFNVTINAPNSDPKSIANAMKQAENKEVGR